MTIFAFQLRRCLQLYLEVVLSFSASLRQDYNDGPLGFGSMDSRAIHNLGWLVSHQACLA